MINLDLRHAGIASAVPPGPGSGLAISFTCHGDGEALEGALTGGPLAALAFPVTQTRQGELARASSDWTMVIPPLLG